MTHVVAQASALAAVLCGCGNTTPFFADASDAGVTVDVGDATDLDRVTPLDVLADVPTDALSEIADDADDAARVDVVDAVADAGTPGLCTPTIDGSIGADWPGNAWHASNAIPTMWGTGSNDLYALNVCFDATNLYIGIEGDDEAANAIVLYIDRDDGAGTGVTDPALLADHTGMLDGAITGSFTSWPVGFGAEWAWGVRGMLAKPAGSTSDTVGLRDITTVTNFAWWGDDDTACSPPGSSNACEIAIPWSRIYGTPRPAHSHVAMFARLVDGLGSDYSNQTLPQDDPSQPQRVMTLLHIAPTP